MLCYVASLRLVLHNLFCEFAVKFRFVVHNYAYSLSLDALHNKLKQV